MWWDRLVTFVYYILDLGLVTFEQFSAFSNCSWIRIVNMNRKAGRWGLHSTSRGDTVIMTWSWHSDTVIMTWPWHSDTVMTLRHGHHDMAMTQWHGLWHGHHDMIMTKWHGHDTDTVIRGVARVFGARGADFRLAPPSLAPPPPQKKLVIHQNLRNGLNYSQKFGY